MELLDIVFISIYSMFGFLAWLAFTCWLHDTKPELNKSWLGSMFIAIALAFVWPISLLMLYFYEKGKPDR